jgi:hypothetical protein
MRLLQQQQALLAMMMEMVPLAVVQPLGLVAGG